MEQCPDILRAELEPGLRALHQSRHVAMRHDTSLGISGRSTGVDHVSGVIRIYLRLRVVSREIYELSSVIQTQFFAAILGNPLRQTVLRNQHMNPCILQHENEPLVRITRIQGQIPRTRFENADDRRH